MKFNVNWDAVGIGTSIACAIHCALLPLLFTSLPLFGMNVIENLSFEIGMIALALVIGTYSLYHGYRKHHHSLVPLFIFFAGFVLLVIKQFFVRFETWILIPAVILIIAAHLMNYRSCKVHAHGHADDCNH